MRLKTSKGKKVTYSLICVFVLAKKKVSTIEMLISLKLVKVLSALYEQKLVYRTQLKNKIILMTV